MRSMKVKMNNSSQRRKNLKKQDELAAGVSLENAAYFEMT